MRALARSVAACLAGAPLPAVAQETTYRIGSGGWVLEHFGSDVALLRASIPAGRPVGDEAGLLLSCDGPDRRARLTFPRPVAATAGRAGTTALLRARAGPAVGTAVLARVAIADRSTLVLSRREGSTGDVVAALGGWLRDRHGGLDLLLSRGPGPVALNRLIPYHLAFTYGSRDAGVIGHFLSACERGTE